MTTFSSRIYLDHTLAGLFLEFPRSASPSEAAALTAVDNADGLQRVWMENQIAGRLETNYQGFCRGWQRTESQMTVD